MKYFVKEAKRKEIIVPTKKEYGAYAMERLERMDSPGHVAKSTAIGAGAGLAYTAGMGGAFLAAGGGMETLKSNKKAAIAAALGITAVTTLAGAVIGGAGKKNAKKLLVDPKTPARAAEGQFYYRDLAMGEEKDRYAKRKEQTNRAYFGPYNRDLRRKENRADRRG